MVLSVIIVNYNVKYFLEQCLYSVERSLRQLGDSAQSEVLVVDNRSGDGSLDYLIPRFQHVRFIANTVNSGFGAANNQALLLAKGEYILFLNPDTILPEDCCAACVNFLRAHPGAGAAGVRMIDGSGRFLRESRRGFPSAWVSFCKLGGLTALFPRSRLFAGYYLGHLPATESHAAPILSGACLWVSREVLDKTGAFDERFFMYAEDIDLSYRIEQHGFTNYYIAGTTILHFKGESTRKDIRYVRMFYKAMSQFRAKHYRGAISAVLMNAVVRTGIWMRAGLAVVRSATMRPDKTSRSGDAAKTEDLRTWITGDPSTAAGLSAILSSGAGMTLVEGPKTAEKIVFCQGENYSFRDCISGLEQYGSEKACSIHAGGSGSVTGSHSKDGRGEVIALVPGSV